MNAKHLYALSAAVLVPVLGASGQVGTLDQVSPVPVGQNSAGFNLSAASLTWQAQIKAAIPGQLEGIRLTLNGNAGAQVNVRVRKGGAPSTNPLLFSALVAKPSNGVEVVFVDMTGSGIMLLSGEVFVMETQGNETGMGLNGSYIAPPGTPLYPEPLYLNGGFFADGGWRHGFQTFMLAVAPPCYANCNGDVGAGGVPLLNLADFGCFQTKFALGDPYADCNGDALLNIADFGCFQTKFALGCP